MMIAVCTAVLYDALLCAPYLYWYDTQLAHVLQEAANAAHTELWVRHDRGASDILECQGFLKKK